MLPLTNFWVPFFVSTNLWVPISEYQQLDFGVAPNF